MLNFCLISYDTNSKSNVVVYGFEVGITWNQSACNQIYACKKDHLFMLMLISLLTMVGCRINWTVHIWYTMYCCVHKWQKFNWTSFLNVAFSECIQYSECRQAQISRYVINRWTNLLKLINVIWLGGCVERVFIYHCLMKHTSTAKPINKAKVVESVDRIWFSCVNFHVN